MTTAEPPLNMKHILLLLTAALLLPLAKAQAPATLSEVKPEPSAPKGIESLLLPLPHEEHLVFIPIEISDSPNIFSYRTFNSGSGNYLNEPITRVKLAGTVFDGAKWYIPFCETEITRGQYAAVMGMPVPTEKEKNLPQTNISITEVQTFLARLNSIMLRNKGFKAAMERYRNEKTSIFFCRLPSPVEWEFAARGGTAVDEGDFDREHPYNNDSIGRYEVLFTGSRTPSPRAVKGRRLPNPLGLYDMLGNVSEMVSPIYYFDSSQGRSGGLLTCGGNFRTEKSAVHASDRSECIPFREDGSEFRSDMVGFRPVIGSVIRHKDMSMNAFSAQWQEHVQELRTPQAPTPTASSEVCLEDLIAQNEQEKKLLLQRVAELEKASGTKTDLDKRAKTIASQLEQAQALVRQSYRLQAESGIMMLSTSAAHLANYLFAEAQLQKLINMPGSTAGPAVQRKLEQIQANIKGARNLLFKGCKLLAEVSPDIITQEVERHQAALLSENKRQHACLKHALDYFHQFKASGKFPDPGVLSQALLSVSH